MGCFDAHVNLLYVLDLHSNFLSASKHHAFKKSCFNFELFSATGRITKIWYNALPLDVMVWVILLAITQRIEGMCLEWFATNNVKQQHLFYSLSGCPRSTKPKSRPKDGPEAETLRYDLFQIVTLMKIWDKFSILNDLFLISNWI